MNAGERSNVSGQNRFSMPIYFILGVRRWNKNIMRSPEFRSHPRHRTAPLLLVQKEQTHVDKGGANFGIEKCAYLLALFYRNILHANISHVGIGSEKPFTGTDSYRKYPECNMLNRYLLRAGSANLIAFARSASFACEDRDTVSFYLRK